MKNLVFQLTNCTKLFLCPFLLFLSILTDLSAQNNIEPIPWKQALLQEVVWYSSTEAIRIADNLLVYQHKTGGWPKNIDMARNLSEEEAEAINKAKNEFGTKFSRATMDNGATSTQLRFLAKVFEQTGQERFKESVLKGVNYLLESQYENGGWPQYYPIRKGYYEHITFNDDAMVNTMRFLKEIYSVKGEFEVLELSDEIKEEARNAFEKGLLCILNTQIYVDGKPTVWCAQHDKNTLAPAKARSYELESFSGSESVGIVLLLMSIDNPTDAIITAINGAIAWFEEHKIEGIRIERINNKEDRDDRKVVEDSNAKPLWGRFYDLQTGMPFFCSRDGVKKSSLAEISYERRNGYRWYTKAPEKALGKYSEWKKKVKSKKLQKPRIIISTDIGGTDPDDFQSMIHYLMYADRFKTEGLISSPYGNGRKEHILEMIAVYEQDFRKLKQHAEFPEPDFLRSITKQGAVSFAPHKGWSEPSEGSQWIVQKANAASDQPLWVLVWGGLEDLAQALHDAPEIEQKIRVYWIGGPNKKWSVHAYLYIARNFPNLWMIEANSTYRGWFIDDDAKEGFGNKTFFENSIKDKGVMGTAFGNYYNGEIKMGDTPSLVYLLSGEAEKPQGESWGGSFIPLPYSAYRFFSRQTNMMDTVPSYSVIEWTFTGHVPGKKAKESSIWMEIDGQRIDGFYEGNGVFKIRFVPKRADTWKYTIHCDVLSLHGGKGEFVSANPWPGKDHPSNIKLNSWWTDHSDVDNFLGKYQGAKTVSKWRKVFLADWALRFGWLEEE